MFCNKCNHIGRFCAISVGKCIMCGGQVVTANSPPENTVCEECSDELNICELCGKELDKK